MNVYNEETKTNSRENDGTEDESSSTVNSLFKGLKEYLSEALHATEQQNTSTCPIEIKYIQQAANIVHTASFQSPTNTLQ